MSKICSQDAAGDPNSQPFATSPEALPAIDETKPSNVASPELDGKKAEAGGKMEGFCARLETEKRNACRKKRMKEKIRGLKDKYVLCLQAIDGAGDMRSCAASGGGPALGVPDPQPFENVASASVADLR